MKDRMEIEKEKLAKALFAILTGRIDGEPNNYEDTVFIMRDVAAKALIEAGYEKEVNDLRAGEAT
jgi:Mg2+/Co2+ transporter CorC